MSALPPKADMLIVGICYVRRKGTTQGAVGISQIRDAERSHPRVGPSTARAKNILGESSERRAPCNAI
jgi:hypothetical protein